MTRTQQAFSTIQALLRDAEIRFQEAEAWHRDDPGQAALELARLRTCIYGVDSEAKFLQSHFDEQENARRP